MKIAYSDAQTPPVPVLPVEIVSRESGTRTRQRSVIVDTGAQVSLYPESDLLGIGASPAGVIELEGLWGTPRAAQMYHVDVQIGDHVLPHVDLVGSPTDDAITGRDILNDLFLHLDGPSHTLEITS